MTYCWRTIDKRTLKPIKTNKQKHNTHPRTREKLQWDRRNAIIIKSNPIPERWATHELENNIPKKFSLCCEGSRLQIRLPNLEIWQRDWGFEVQKDLITELPQDLGKQRHGGHKQNLASTRTQRKGIVTPQKTEPDLPVRIWESPAEVWVSSSLFQGQWLWQQGSGRCRLA